MERKKDFLKMLPLILLFSGILLLRLYRLAYHDFWYDEVLTVYYSGAPFQSWNPSLYFFIVGIFVKLFGASEWAVRLPSLIFGILCIVCIFFMAKELFTRRIAVYASVFSGISAFHIWYSQEARSYSMLAFVAVASGYFLYKALIKKDTFSWIWFVIFSAAGIYSHYFYAVMLMAQLLYIAIFIAYYKERKGLFLYVFVFAAVAVSLLPILPKFLLKVSKMAEGFWIPAPSLNSIRFVLENFMLGYGVGRGVYFVADILLACIIAVLVFKVVKDKPRANIFFVCSFFILPFLITYIFSVAFFSVFISRALIIAFPYFCILLAVGADRIGRGSIFVVAGLMLYGSLCYYYDLMPLPVSHHIGTYVKRPVKPILNYIESNASQSDICCFTNHVLMLPFNLYRQRDLRYYYLFDPEIIDTTWKDPFKEDGFYTPVKKAGEMEFRYLWLIASDWARDGQLCDNSQSVKRWLDKNMHLISAEEINGSWVLLYEH